MARVDVAVVGGGHNGLICAAYLARAGRRVVVLERSNELGGGAASRDDLVPGCRVDVGASIHVMIHQTPIVEELELPRFGLEYLWLDPWGFYPIPESADGIAFFRDLDRTCAEIARVSPRDADAYRALVEWLQSFAGDLRATFLVPPRPVAIGLELAGKIAGNARTWLSPSNLARMFKPYDRLFADTFESEAVRSALTWLIAQTGVPPGSPATLACVFLAAMHTTGAALPRGGSGELPRAVAARIRADGGEVRTSAPVSRIRRAGSRWELQLEDEVIVADRVVSAIHVQTLFGQLLEDPPRIAEKVRRLRIGDAFGTMVRHSVRELPKFGGVSRPREYSAALNLLAPSTAALLTAYREGREGRPSSSPCVVAFSSSARDPSVAPPDRSLLSLWGQYHPFELKSGERWSDVAEREADKLWAHLCRHAPNMKGALLDRYVATPEEVSRTLALPRGNISHLGLELNQLFFMRPLPALSQYRTPLPGLYLTGASTHPGGAVFGASGRNTAHVGLGDA